jgi:hypothetical protein
MKCFSLIASTLTLSLACTAVVAAPAPQSSGSDGQACTNQVSGNIYIDFDNIDVEKGSSFSVKIGSLNTGNIANTFAGAASVVVNQTSGDIYVNFDDMNVDKGGHFSVNVGTVNTGNTAITQTDARHYRHPGHGHGGKGKGRGGKGRGGKGDDSKGDDSGSHW